jgi:hypothetical protein
MKACSHQEIQRFGIRIYTDMAPVYAPNLAQKL